MHAVVKLPYSWNAWWARSHGSRKILWQHLLLLPRLRIIPIEQTTYIDCSHVRDVQAELVVYQTNHWCLDSMNMTPRGPPGPFVDRDWTVRHVVDFELTNLYIDDGISIDSIIDRLREGQNDGLSHKDVARSLRSRVHSLDIDGWTKIFSTLSHRRGGSPSAFFPGLATLDLTICWLSLESLGTFLETLAATTGGPCCLKRLALHPDEEEADIELTIQELLSAEPAFWERLPRDQISTFTCHHRTHQLAGR